MASNIYRTAAQTQYVTLGEFDCGEFQTKTSRRRRRRRQRFEPDVESIL